MGSTCLFCRRCCKNSSWRSMSRLTSMESINDRLSVKISSWGPRGAARTLLALKEGRLIISFKMSLQRRGSRRQLFIKGVIAVLDHWPCKTKRFPAPTHVHPWAPEPVTLQRELVPVLLTTHLCEKCSSAAIVEQAETATDSSKTIEETQIAAKVTAWVGKRLITSKSWRQLLDRIQKPKSGQAIFKVALAHQSSTKLINRRNAASCLMEVERILIASTNNSSKFWRSWRTQESK